MLHPCRSLTAPIAQMLNAAGKLFGGESGDCASHFGGPDADGGCDLTIKSCEDDEGYGLPCADLKEYCNYRVTDSKSKQLALAARERCHGTCGMCYGPAPAA